jgi:hypothetical protein
MRSGIYIIAMIFTLMMQPISAGTTVIPGHSASDQAQSMPERGVKMESVLSNFGEPVQRYSAIGEPPITEWVYNSFRVYFEYETVLHSIDMNTLIMPK